MKELVQKKHFQREPAIVVAAITLSLLTWAVLISLVGPAVEYLKQHSDFFGVLWADAHLSLRSLMLVPLGIIGVNAIVLFLEYLDLGWERSALRRVLFLTTSTSRTDFFYFVLRVSGLMHILAFVLTFGTVYIASSYLGVKLRFDLLSGTPMLFQFLVVVLINTFVFYWAHRLMHTRHLFEIHKVHHSAIELNVLTPLRNHPVDFIIMILVNSVPAAILGASPMVVSLYLIVNGLYQSAVHSEMTKLENPIMRSIIITPATHKVHHSSSAKHFDRNFGILTLWERLFGTYYQPSGEDLRLGVEDDHNFNTPQPVRELFSVMHRWLRGFPPRRS